MKPIQQHPIFGQLHSLACILPQVFSYQLRYPASRIVGTTKGIDVDEKGYVIVGDRPKGMTTRRGVFAGGDVVHRPQTVVLAMKAAKEVAVGIAQYVDAIKLLEECGQ